MGEDECRRLVAREYQNVRRELRTLHRIAPDQAAASLAALDIKEAEVMADVDKVFADRNAARAEYLAADSTEADALAALCAYHCRTMEEVRIKAECLLSVDVVDAKALL